MAAAQRPGDQQAEQQEQRRGTSAPRKMSWVLTMRTIALVTLAASVWARIMASPSRISTSEGGITTPSVEATQTSAVLSAGGCRARELGRDAARQHGDAGADRAVHRRQQGARPRVAIAGAPPLRPPSATPQRNSGRRAAGG
jgi:hypothetical protein